MADDEQKTGVRQKINSGMETLFARIGKLSRVQRLLICLVTFLILGGGYYYLN
jgi:type IV pilus assembly protein PilO